MDLARVQNKQQRFHFGETAAVHFLSTARHDKVRKADRWAG